MTAAPGTVAGWLGIEDERWIRWVGAVLAIHGLAIAAVFRRADVARWARLDVASIATYPLLVIALVVAGVIDRAGGIALALADAGAIAVIAGGLVVAMRAERRAASSA